MKTGSLVLISLPALVLALAIAHYGVDVPYWDEWAPSMLAPAARHGTLTFQQLIAQQNDSREFFPRLLFLTIDLTGRGNVKYEMFTMFLLAAVSMWNVYRLAMRTIAGVAARMLAITFASLLIFSAIQWQNWLWGIQIVVFLPVATFTTAIVTCYSDWSGWRKLWISAVLLTVATFSYANGMICWALLTPLVLMQFPAGRTRARAAALWIACAALNLAAYFRGYRWLGNTGNPSDILKLPAKAARCFLAFLGAPFSSARGLADLDRADAFGLLVLLAAGVAAYRVARSWKEPGVARKTAGWATMAAYGLTAAVITTAGRVKGAAEFLLDSRYTTFSLYLPVGLIGLLAALHGKRRFRAMAGLTGLLVLAHSVNCWYLRIPLYETRVERLRAKGCLAFLNLIDSPCQAALLDGNLVELKQSANAMDEFGYLRPGLLRSPDIRAIAGSAGGPSGQHGSFESLTRIDQRFYRAAGWAVLPDRTEAAHAVLLTYSRADGAEVLLSLADQGIERLDIARQTGESKYVRSGWEQWLEIPEGADRVKAWAYDALSGHAFPLAGDQHASAAPVESIQYKLDNGGTFDSLIPGESYTANGWAMLWEHPKRADRVLLTCGGGNELIATAAPSTPRPDVMVAFHDLRLGGSGWTVTFSASRVPAEGCQLKAWAWDRHDRKAMLLTPSHLIPARAP